MRTIAGSADFAGYLVAGAVFLGHLESMMKIARMDSLLILLVSYCLIYSGLAAVALLYSHGNAAALERRLDFGSMARRLRSWTSTISMMCVVLSVLFSLALVQYARLDHRGGWRSAEFRVLAQYGWLPIIPLGGTLFLLFIFYDEIYGPLSASPAGSFWRARPPHAFEIVQSLLFPTMACLLSAIRMFHPSVRRAAALERARKRGERLCDECGYRLGPDIHDRCSECGAAISPAHRSLENSP